MIRIVFIVIASSALLGKFACASEIEGLQRSLYQRKMAATGGGLTFPARISDGKSPDGPPPDGFYDADLSLPNGKKWLVDDLSSQVASLAKACYIQDDSLEGTKRGQLYEDGYAYSTQNYIEPSSSDFTHVGDAIPMLPATAPIEARIARIKEVLSAMKVAVVNMSEGEYGVLKTATATLQSPQTLTCGAAYPKAMLAWQGAQPQPGLRYQAFINQSANNSVSPKNADCTLTTATRQYVWNAGTVRGSLQVFMTIRGDSGQDPGPSAPIPADGNWHYIGDGEGQGTVAFTPPEVTFPKSDDCGQRGWAVYRVAGLFRGEFEDQWSNGNDCKSCESDFCTDVELGSIKIRIGTGKARYGKTPAYFTLEADKPIIGLCSPRSLRAFSQGEAQVIYAADGGVRQMLTPTTLVDVVKVNLGFEVRIYPRSAAGVLQQDKTYAIQANVPVTRTITIRNGTTTSQTVDYNTVEVLVIEGVKTVVSTYTFDPANDVWSLQTGNGLRREELVTTWDVTHTERTKTRTLYNAEGQVTSRTQELFDQFPWGEEMVSRTLDPGGAALTTSWSYYTDPAQIGKYGKLARRVDPSGYWETYDYDAYGRRTKLVAQWKDTVVASADNLNRVVTTTFLDSNPVMTEVESIEGVEVKRRYQAYINGDTHDIEAVSSGAAWDNSANLVTITRSIATGSFAGRVQSVLRPDGTATIYDYSRNDSLGTETTVTSVGKPNAGRTAVVDGRRFTVTVDKGGNELTSEEADIVSGLVLSSKTRTDADAHGRPTVITFEDGTTEININGCCGADSFTDRVGTVTEFKYDALGRRNEETRSGITLLTDYSPEGLVVGTRRKGTDQSEITLTTTHYDLAGRMDESTEPPANNGTVRRTTVYAEQFLQNGQKQRTTTYPGGGTRIEVFHRDGQLLKVTGSAVAPLRYEYGTADVTRNGATIHCTFTKEIKLDASGVDTSEWTTTYKDMAGRVTRVQQPRELNVGGNACTDYFYYTGGQAGAGQIAKVSDPDGVITLFTYNDKGEQEIQAIDMNRNGLVDLGGPDRITKTMRSVVNRDGDKVERTTVQVWQQDGIDAATNAAIIDATSNNRKVWETRFGLPTSKITSLLGGGQTKTVTTFPDNSTLEEVVVNGRPTSNKRLSAAPVQTITEQSFGYDAHGRLQTIVDARNGETTYAYYSDDRVRSITLPAPDAQTPRQITSYTYHLNGQKETETLPDQAVVNYTYWPTNALKRTWGARVYPVEYGYDPQGRLKTLTTWQNFAGLSNAAVTTWNYDPASGRLIRKLYQDAGKGSKGPSYTYKPSGRLESRTWQRGAATTYNYDNAGNLWTVDYSDTTPDVAITRDRMGHPWKVTDAAGSRELQYTGDGRLELERFTAGMFQGFNIDPHFDDKSRRDSLSVNWSAGSVSTGYGYDGASRLRTVTKDNASATYTYEPQGGNLVQKIEITSGGQLVLRTDSPHDKASRLQSITSTWIPTGKVVSGFTYTHNAANQRERVELSNGTHWRYGYDTLGQVTSGKRYWSSSNTEVAGQQYGYIFDDIGNRKTATVNGRVSSYTPNLLNQYDKHTVPGAADVLGEAAFDATVTVNGERATRQGAYFHKAVNVANTPQAYSGEVSVMAVKNNAGPQGEDAVAQENRPLYVAETPESFSYDDDGNLTQDGRWKYTWDGENRLIEIETLTGLPSSVPRLKLKFGYDWLSRRLQKQVWSWKVATSSYELHSQTGFVYDGWNLLAEYDQLNSSALVRSYTWGLDLSGTEQRAGGVGGLLFGRFHAVPGSPACFYTYDGNGNVATVGTLSDATIQAAYEYGPFSEIIRSTGTLSQINPFRFSTKYQDDETELLYYGFRYYHSQVGRWLSRDPIEEGGGLNLAGFCYNGPVNFYDRQGADADAIDGNSIASPVSLPMNLLAQFITYAKGDYLTPRLLRHYAYGQGRTYVLGYGDVKMLNITPPLSVSFFHRITVAINEVERNGGCQEVRDRDYNMKSSSPIGNNSLANFGILIKGKVCCTIVNGKRRARFSGYFRIDDTFDFDVHWWQWLTNPQYKRDLGGEFYTTGGYLFLEGTPFPVVSEWLPIQQQNLEPEAHW